MYLARCMAIRGEDEGRVGFRVIHHPILASVVIGVRQIHSPNVYFCLIYFIFN
jgi:hypothetical protein